MELRLLNSLTSKEVYTECAGIIAPDIFSSDLEDIMIAIQELHSKFDEDIDMDIVKEHIHNKKISTTAKKALLDDIINKVISEEVLSVSIAKEFIFNLSRKSRRLKALNRLAQVIEKNEESHDDVVTILSELPVEDADADEIVGTSNQELREFYDSGNRYPFNIESLQRNIGGMSRGNLAIVFGRPEIGKSSFIAHLVAGFIERGIITEYYANEEPGRKIMLNIRRAVTGETDAHIAESIRNDIDNTQWLKAAENLKVRQIGTMGIDTIISRAKRDNPEVIILDQVDKLSLANGHNAPSHERLRDLYMKTRQLAKDGDCLVINVSQASVIADEHNNVTYDMLDGSKTGKAGEADVIIGIGKRNFLTEQPVDIRHQLRYIGVSKNKISGWHGLLPVNFDPTTNQWKEAEDENCY